jgi:hypothetical protein
LCDATDSWDSSPRAADTLVSSRGTALKALTPTRLLTREFWLCAMSLLWTVSPILGQQKPDELLVYGDKFIFSVKEPTGWHGDTTNAEKFQSNAVLHEDSQPTDSTSGLIRISVNDKVDEDTLADLKADMRDYKAQYPAVQFKALIAKNPNYKCLARVFYVPGKFYEYVAYVNPGVQKPLLFSVAMNTGKAEATEKELEAFGSAIQSLKLVKP